MSKTICPKKLDQDIAESNSTKEAKDLERLESLDKEIEETIDKLNFDALEEVIQKQTSSERDQRNQELIEKADEQRYEERKENATKKVFQTVSNKFSGIFDMLFAFLNQLLEQRGIKPLSKIEQSQIIQVFIEFTSTAVAEKIQDTEKIINASKSAPKFMHLITVLVVIILPRLIEYQRIQKQGG